MMPRMEASSQRRLRITKRGLILNPFMSAPISEESPKKAAAAGGCRGLCLWTRGRLPPAGTCQGTKERTACEAETGRAGGGGRSTGKAVVRPEGSFLCFIDWSKDAPIVVEDDALETGSMSRLQAP